MIKITNRKTYIAFFSLLISFMLLVQTTAFAYTKDNDTNVAPDIPEVSAEVENNLVDLVIATDYQGAKLDQVKAKAKQLEQRASEKGIDLSTTFLTGKKEIVNQNVTRKKQNLVRYAYVNTYDYQYGSTVLKNRIPIEYDNSVKFEQDIYHTPEFPKGEAFSWSRGYGDYGAGSGLFRDICWRRYNGSVYENWFQCYIPIQMYNPNNMSGTVINYEFITQNAHTYTQSYSSEYHYNYPDNLEPLSFYSMDVTCPAQWSVKATVDSTYVEKVEALDFSKLDNKTREDSKKYIMLLTDSKRDISFQYPFGQYYPFGSMRQDNVGEFCKEATAYIAAPAEITQTKMPVNYPAYISPADKQDMSLADVLALSSENKAYLPSELDAALDNLLANALPKGKKVDVVVATDYRKEKLTELNNQLNTMKVNALEKGVDLQTYVLNNEIKVGTTKVYAPRETYTRNVNVTFNQQITYERSSSGSPVYSWPDKAVTLKIPYETCDISPGEALPAFSKSANYVYTISEQKVDVSYMNTSNWGTVANKVERYYDLEIFDPNNKAATLVTYRLDSELTYIDLIDGGRDGFQSYITNIKINSIDTSWGIKSRYDKEHTSEVKAVDFSRIASLGLRADSRKYIIYLTGESDLPGYGDDFGDYYGFGSLTKAAYDSYMSRYDFTSYVAAPEAALNLLLSDSSYKVAYTAPKQDYTLQEVLDRQPSSSMYYTASGLKTALEDIVFTNGKHVQNKIDIIAATDYTGQELASLTNSLKELKDTLTGKGYDVATGVIDGAACREIGTGNVPEASVKLLKDGTVISSEESIDFQASTLTDRWFSGDEAYGQRLYLDSSGYFWITGRCAYLLADYAAYGLPWATDATPVKFSTLSNIKAFIYDSGFVFLKKDGNICDLKGNLLRNTGTVTRIARNSTDSLNYAVDKGRVYYSPSSSSWTQVQGLENVTDIKAMGRTILCLTEEGSVYAWSASASSNVPVKISMPAKAKEIAISAGGKLLALGTDFNLYQGASAAAASLTKCNIFPVFQLIGSDSGNASVYVLGADTYLYSYSNGTFTKTEKNSSRTGAFYGVNTVKVREATNLAGRSGADKLFIAAMRGEGNTISTPYGTYYGFGNLSGSFINELVRNRTATYTLTSKVNLDYKLTGAGISLPVQNATLRDITNNSVDGGGQNADSLKQLQNLIIKRYKPFKTGTGQTVYMVLGESFLTTSMLATDYESDPLNAEEWKLVSHDPNVFENNQGMNAAVGKYVDSVDSALDKVGKYEIAGRVQDNPKAARNLYEQFVTERKWSGDSLPVTVYVHRRPIARFIVSSRYNEATRLCTLGVRSTSYDLDHQSQTDKGITQSQFEYKLSTDDAWQPGIPSAPVPVGLTYNIRLKVKDYEGAWSNYYQQDITTLAASTNEAPAVTISKSLNYVYEGDDIDIIMKPSDPDNDELVLILEEKKDSGVWKTVYTRTACASGSTQKYSISSIPAGEYEFRVAVTDPDGETAAATLTFTANELTIKGRVDHTDIWKSNWVKYNRHLTDKGRAAYGSNTFFTGEKYILSAATTSISPDSDVTALGVTVKITERTYASVNLIKINPYNFSGEMWKEDMKGTRWRGKTATFLFSVTYSNGTVKTDSVVTNIVDDDYWRIKMAF